MEEQRKNHRSSFSNKLGYILAAAGSAVGLGNIWRFPYLAAKYGGGIFLLVYIILTVTFGYTMIMSESALGRMTRKSPVGAFRFFGNSVGFHLGGWINAIAPMILVPYYCAIGGWVVKYLFEYCRGSVNKLAGDGYFGGYMADPVQAEVTFLIFGLCTLVIVFMGVQSGIERVSKIMMPILIILAVIVSIYAVTRPGAMAGVAYLFIPKFEDFSWRTVVAAMEQMFYSLSIAMGILVTFGSYMPKEMDIEKSTHQVSLCDTAIAFLAALMVIPAVFAYSGGDPDVLQSGPSLMFVMMPKIFADMEQGSLIGILFFVLVFFAALTSSIALTESAVSTFEDELGLSRKPATVLMGVILIGLGSLSAFGFNILDFVHILGMDFLDFFDFLVNSIFLPLGALATCILIVRVIGIRKIEEEVQGSSAFRERGIYRFMIRYLCPLFIVIILVASFLSVFGVISI